jgi:hypothetical protein
MKEITLRFIFNDDGKLSDIFLLSTEKTIVNQETSIPYWLAMESVPGRVRNRAAHMLKRILNLAIEDLTIDAVIRFAKLQPIRWRNFLNNLGPKTGPIFEQSLIDLKYLPHDYKTNQDWRNQP